MSIAMHAASAISNAASGSMNPLGAAPGSKVPAEPFANLISDAIGDVNSLQQQAGDAVRGLITGSGVDVHQAMIATEKASMSFELALAVRNKAVQAYQQVMGLQF